SSSPSGSEFPSVSSYGDNDPTVVGEINGLCTQMCALETASPPGYSTARKKVTIHTLAFGPIIAGANSSDRTAAVATLASMEAIGNVPASDRIDSANTYKIISG